MLFEPTRVRESSGKVLRVWESKRGEEGDEVGVSAPKGTATSWEVLRDVPEHLWHGSITGGRVMG